MKTIADEPINPITEDSTRKGLSKREYFAAMAMQGMLAASISTALAAEYAVLAADRLINHLNLEKE